MKFKVICCDVFFRELCALAVECPHTLDVEFHPKGLHDLGSDKMMPRLQERVDAVTGKGYDAIILIYALCNNGIAGLKARDTKIVVAKAHDCISLFMGSSRRYKEYFDTHPGTYFRTTGWIEHEDSATGDETISQKLGLFMEYNKLVEMYGEENAQYIQETMGANALHYTRLTYINMGLPCEAQFIGKAKEEAKDKGWEYEELKGDMSLLKKLLYGNWDEAFLVVQPGQEIKPSYDEHVIKLN